MLCVDAEPDERAPAVDVPARWRGLEATFALVERLRDPLAEATGLPVHVSWYLRMDPQVGRIYGTTAWAAETYAEEIATLRAFGDELGLHPHAWRWRERTEEWVVDHGSQEWVDHCVSTAFTTFRECFGMTCRSHRFGDHFLSDRTLDLLARLGMEVDLTTEPGEPAVPTIEPHAESTGCLPDFTSVPRAPYQPSRSDFRRPGGAGDRRDVWMLPLSATTEGPGVPRVRPWRRGRGDTRHRLLAMWRPWTSPGDFWEAALRSTVDQSRPYLALAMRSDAALGPRRAADFESMLRHLVAHPEVASRLCFVTPTQALRDMGLVAPPECPRGAPEGEPDADGNG